MSHLKALRLTALAVVLSLSAVAQWPTPKPISKSFINDYANVLPQPFVDYLDGLLKGFETSDSVQMAVIITNQLPLDQSIEDYAHNIGQDWHVGNYRNGIVFVWDVLGHRLRMEVARNLEPVLTDAQAAGILNNMKAFLKAGQTTAAIETMIRQTITTVHTAHVAKETVVDIESKKGFTDYVVDDIWLIGFVIVLIVSGVMVYTWSRRKKLEVTPETEGDGKIHTALGDEFEVDPYAVVKRSWNDRLTEVRKHQTDPPPVTHIPPSPKPRYEEPTRIIPVITSDPSPSYRSDDSPSLSSSSGSDNSVSWGGNDGGSSAGFDGGGASASY